MLIRQMCLASRQTQVNNKSVGIAKKADRTAYDVRYRLAAEPNRRLDPVAAGTSMQ